MGHMNLKLLLAYVGLYNRYMDIEPVSHTTLELGCM